MDWPLAIARNRQALLAIVVALMAAVGLVDGHARTLLPRQIYGQILRVLRPAEAAVRRLIMIVAYGQNFVVRSSSSTNTLKNNINWWQNLSAQPQLHMRFALTEPLRRFSTHRFQPISCPPPRISVPGFLDPIFAVPALLSSDDQVQTQLLGRRLLALKRALENLPREAKRLARWHARRASKSKPQRRVPVRMRPPITQRPRNLHAVHAILKECHALMRDRLELQNTS